MINAKELGEKIVEDAMRYHYGMQEIPIITMSSGAKELLKSDQETNSWFYIEFDNVLGFRGFFVSIEQDDRVWYQVGRRKLFKD